MDIIGNDMVCRLCSKTPLSQFTIIGETAKEILDVLLVKMDLDISIKPLMCEDCTEIVKRSLSFKSVCIDTEEMLVDAGLLQAHDDNAHVCRFCMTKVEEGHFIPLDGLTKGNPFLNMIKKYMFHVDLSITKDPLICFNCRDNMESYFKFLQNCRDTEEKINTYQRNNGMNRQSIMLVDVSESCSKFAKKELCNSLMEIEGEFDSDMEGVMNPLLHQNVDISDHVPCICDSKDSSHSFRCLSMFKEDALATEDIKVETVPSEVDNRELKIESEELIIKDEVTLNESTSPKKQPGGRSKALLFERDKYEFKTKNSNMHKRHLLVHKDSSEVQMYQCDCCGFQTKRKGNLKKHILVHKDSSEVQMYQCDCCGYQTKRKDSLKKHMLIHMDSSPEVQQMYKCNNCEYQTKCKSSLTRHMIVHKDSSEVQYYQCPSCEFKTKYKNNFETHKLIHKDPSEVQVYQCDSCDYQTKRKGNLKNHILIHKDLSEVQLYQCDICEYQSKFKGRVKTHMLTVHNYLRKAQVYQCCRCKFQTKHKGMLKRHMLCKHHKGSSEVQM